MSALDSLSIEDWSNWSGAVACPGAVIDRPADEAALSALVAETEGTLRPVGSGHSFVPFWMPGDRLVVLDAFSGLEAVDETVVRLGAGTPIHAIGPLLAERGLALANQGDIDRQTLAGAVSTGTHGTGLRLGSLSSTVRAVRLVDGTGAVRRIDGGEALEALRVSLGLLGIFTSLELETVPLYGLRERNVVESVDACLEALDERTNRHRHHEFWWVPREDACIAKTLDPIEVPGVPRLDEVPFGEAGERWGASWQVFPSVRDLRFQEMEYAVPLAAGPACFAEVRAALLADFPDLPWPIEYRVVAGDDGWLSPTAGRSVATLSVHQGAERDCRPLFERVEPILRAHGGRPHWGKWHDCDRDALAARYPRLEDFARLRAEFDPQQRFLGAWLRERLLG